MESFGCKTPFGPTKEKICTNKTIGSQANEMYKDMFTFSKYNCSSPCDYITTRVNIHRESVQGYVNGKKATLLKIKLNEHIKVTNEQYLYSGLSLIAEIGGYVGLFLGVSVNQIIDLVDFIITRIQNLQWKA